jgi:disulfide bond formation protein DsbB
MNRHIHQNFHTSKANYLACQRYWQSLLSNLYEESGTVGLPCPQCLYQRYESLGSRVGVEGVAVRVGGGAKPRLQARTATL